jgi:hypothetical protein
VLELAAAIRRHGAALRSAAAGGDAVG